MLNVMQKAVSIDDKQAVQDQQLLTQLQTENETLRQLLQVSI